MEWEIRPLADIAAQEKGAIKIGPFGSQLKKSELTDSGVHVVGIENVLASTFDGLGDRYISSEKFDTLRSVEIQAGDVLITMMGTVGAAAVVPEGTSTSIIDSHLLRFRPNRDVCDPRFVVRFLESPLATHGLSGRAHGAIMKGLNSGIVRSLQIPLPLLSEQHRIVEILDQADHLRRLRTEANTKADRILPALFLKMFGDPATNPMGWPTKPLTDVVESLEAGWSAKGEARTKRENEYGVLKVSAVTSRVFRREEHKAVAPGQIERELVTPKRGDLLFSRANTRELVAATCIVEADEPHLFLPDKLWRVNLRSNRATAHFLHQVLGVPAFRDTLRARATGTSGSMLNVPQDVFLAARAPIPPIDLQARFSKAAWKVLDVRRATAAAERRLLELWGRVLCRAFSGDLTESWRKHHEGQLRAEMRCQAQALAEAE
jgi:type I restriction enzyme S subunit